MLKCFHLLWEFALNFKAIHEIVTCHKFVQYKHSVITNLDFSHFKVFPVDNTRMPTRGIIVEIFTER